MIPIDFDDDDIPDEIQPSLEARGDVFMATVERADDPHTVTRSYYVHDDEITVRESGSYHDEMIFARELNPAPLAGGKIAWRGVDATPREFAVISGFDRPVHRLESGFIRAVEETGNNRRYWHLRRVPDEALAASEDMARAGCD